MIEVSGLTKRYRDRIAVDDLSFSIGRGEVVGFLGPNGAGKTTTLRMLTGYLPATVGHGAGGRVRRLRGAAGGPAPHRLPAGDPAALRRDDGAGVPALRRRAEGARAGAPRRRGGAGGRPDRRRRRSSTGSPRTSPRASGSGWASPRPCSATRRCSSSTSPPWGSTPSRSGEVRDLVRSLGGRHTVILSTHLLPEVAMTCSKVLVLQRRAAGGLRHPRRAHRPPPPRPEGHARRHRLPRGDLREARHPRLKPRARHPRHRPQGAVGLLHHPGGLGGARGGGLLLGAGLRRLARRLPAPHHPGRGDPRRRRSCSTG